MSENCLFCRIAKGEVSAHIVHEDDRIVCFLDICPIRRGHLQIMPREHFPYFESIPAELASSIMLLGQKFATGMKTLYHVKRVAFLFSGGTSITRMRILCRCTIRRTLPRGAILPRRS